MTTPTTSLAHLGNYLEAAHDRVTRLRLVTPTPELQDIADLLDCAIGELPTVASSREEEA